MAENDPPGAPPPGSAEGPGLEDAFALRTPEESVRLYRQWAARYDTGFAAEQGYRIADRVAELYAGVGGAGPVLDIGAGTGLVAVRLKALGIGPVDGADISPEMLAVAARKDVYRRSFVADVTAGLPVPDGAYRGAVSAGTFTLGHVGPEPLEDVARIVAPGGWLAIAVNRRHWEAAGFDTRLAALAPLFAETEIRETPIYEGGQGAHAGDTACVLLARRA